MAKPKKEYSIKCPRCFSIIEFTRSRVTHGRKFLVVCNKCRAIKYVAIFEKVVVYDLEPIE